MSRKDLLEKEMATHSSILAWNATPRACVLSHFSHVHLFVTLWTVVCQAPLTTGSSGKNTGVACYALLQGIFLTQGSDPHLFHLLHRQVGSLPLVPPRKPMLQSTVSQSQTRLSEWAHTSTCCSLPVLWLQASDFTFLSLLPHPGKVVNSSCCIQLV